jgi:hypothetical protein
MRFLLKRSPETHHNHEMKRASTSHLAAAVSCQLSAATSLCTQIFTIFCYLLTHEYFMNNNKNKATMKETSKNCVSDYPCRILRVPNAA